MFISSQWQASPATMRRAVLCMLAGATLASGARAQVDMDEQDYFQNLPIVLSVSRLAQPLSETPGAVTVIDRQTIIDLNPRDITDVLRLVPGFMVNGYNGASPIAVYHAPLDEFGVRNLVLIDGRPAYSSYYFGGTARGLMAVEPQDVERVEVLRGANSAAFGANAMFGVVNIVTRHSADTLGAGLTLRAGGGGVRDGRFSLGWGDATASYRLSANTRGDEGYRELYDSRRLTQLSLRADLRPGPQDEIQLDAGVRRLRSGEGYAGDINNPQRDIGWHDWHLNAQWRHELDPGQQLKLSLSATRERFQDRFNYQPLPAIVVDFSGTGERLDLELQHQRPLGDTMRLVWGAGVRRESAQSFPLFYRSDSVAFRESRLFGNLEWRPAKGWLVNGGLFLGHHSWVGGFATPRLMVNYELAPNHTLRAGANHSVRTPTLFELAGDVRYDLAGTTIARTFAASGSVRPERLFSREIGYFGNFPERRLSLDIRVFDERMKGFVGRRTYRLGAFTVFDYTNQLGPTNTGFEYQLRWSPTARTQIWLNQSFMEMEWGPRIDVAQPPRHASSLAVFHEWPNRLKTGLVWTVRGKMEWRGIGEMLKSAHQLDIHLAYPFRIGAANARAALTLRGVNGSYTLFESRFSRPTLQKQAYATFQVDF